jgi:hypothetical protein
MRRFAAVAGLLAIALVVGMLRPGSVLAQDDPPTSIEWEGNALVVTASAPGTLRLTDEPGAPFAGPVIRCAWFEVVVGGATLDIVHLADPVAGETYVYHCWHTHPWVDPYPGYPIVAVHDPTAGPPGALITTETAARFALDSIEFETPEPVTSPPGASVVGIPTWFAVATPLDYEPASAQAGPVWATVRPIFRDTTWNLGEGTRVVCTADSTTRWRPSGPDDQHSACVHTFSATPTDPAASVTVHWTVLQRTDRTAGAWIPWGTVSLTTPLDLEVIDLQAVIN